MIRLELLLYCALLGFAAGFAVGAVGMDEAIETPEMASYEFTCTTDEECESEYDHYLDIWEGMQR